ncbi:MAG TPA: TrmH family RNA methyltransferase [Bacteroidales bacterium]|nr:TrmH family RNA methyltransferase [Bacteroidales bacterium]
MYEKELIKYLEKFVSERRVKLFDEVLSYRTKYITLVLEDIYQPHNASAVLRTCDCLGIQEVNIIENRNKYSVNPDVALGADKWLDMIKYNRSDNNTTEAFKNLRGKGYRIVATTLHEGDEVSLDKFDINKGEIALVFGTEMHGLSKQAVDNADEYLKIPMLGFTESFNISVSAAIITYQLVKSLHESDIPWQLSENEKMLLKLNWLRKTIKRSELLEKKFIDMKSG